MAGHCDLMHVITPLLDKLGPCSTLCIATLSYNPRNLAEMLTLLDSWAVNSLTLLCSSYFRDHNKDLWRDTLIAFRQRGQRAAAARSHCKVVCLHFADGGKMVLERPANLRTNSNREQLTLIRDDALYDWHSTWIDKLVSAHHGESNQAAD